jgi:hypothetical protein
LLQPETGKFDESVKAGRYTTLKNMFKNVLFAQVPRQLSFKIFIESCIYAFKLKLKQYVTICI